MNHGRTIFAQLLDFLPFKQFEYLVEKFSAVVTARRWVSD